MSSILSVQHLQFSYPDYQGMKKEILFKDLNLEMQSGDRVLILGKPDAGKSTLSRILTGLIPRHTGGSLSGTILLGKTPLENRKPYDLLHEVGLLSQDPDEQLLTTRIDSEILFAMESQGLDPAEMQKRLEEALDWMGISDFSERNPVTLSGGEKKKDLLAALYAQNPPFVILDETLEELDQSTRKRLFRWLRETGKTTLMMASRIDELTAEQGFNLFLLKDGCLNPLQNNQNSTELTSRLLKEGLLLATLGELGETTPDPGPLQADPILSLKKIHWLYDDNPDFHLQIEDFRIYEGETIALLGPNGGGKSTLGKILCGLLEPDSGQINQSAQERKRTCAYLFQNPDYQIFLPTVRDELAYGLKMSGLPKKEIDLQVHRTISLFKLPDEETPPSLMSYGSRKKLQAGVYHLLDRRVIILDEADSGLTYLDFMDLLTHLKSRKKGVVIITHNRKLAELTADRILTVQGGILQ